MICVIENDNLWLQKKLYVQKDQLDRDKTVCASISAYEYRIQNEPNENIRNAQHFSLQAYVSWCCLFLPCVDSGIDS